MIRRNQPPPKPFKVIKGEKGIEIAEDCALVLVDCKDVILRGGRVSKADRSGIYLQRNCHGVQILDYKIDEACGAGIYIDSGCSHTLIERTKIRDCGYWVSERDWRKSKYDIRRFGFLKREGIAIDDSQFNTVRNCKLINNALAGITLYRNCGEYQSFRRGAGANHNTIETNVFSKSRVGVWNGAREWRDLSSWDCLTKGENVPLWRVPKQPYQQWWDWSAFIQCLTGNFQWPINWRIHKVPDVALNNTISEDNLFFGVKHPAINNSKATAWAFAATDMTKSTAS